MKKSEWDPLKHPGHYFSRIARGLARIGDARLRDLGFATAQLPVLGLLKNGERLSQAELVNLLKVEQSSMAQLLARMERDGLISRKADPNDRRSSIVSLTKKAVERLPAGQDVLRQGNADMTAGFSKDEIETLISLLGRVLANIENLEKNLIEARDESNQRISRLS